VREDRERLGRAAGDCDDQVLEPDAAASGDRRRERLAADAKPQFRYLVGKPLASAYGSGRARRAVGKGLRQIAGQRDRTELVERRRQSGDGCPQRRRLADAESRD
jgi:hypothetical protein